jgi:murein DD-endopeptidase MepM/ murein hydrolase activator NlpD
MEKHQKIEEVLKGHYPEISPLMKLGIQSDEEIIQMDFTEQNEEFKKIDISDTKGMTNYMESLLENYKKIGVGGYGEDRYIYRRSSLFDGEKEPRSIHLGIDIWVPAYTKVFAPLDSRVHSFNFNDNFGDYGGTIILQHELENVVFYTLYGHLSKASLDGLSEGKKFEKGTHFADIGDEEDNGHWPPHLHFQLISDMLDKKGDFYGVAPPSEKDYYLKLCPDPRLIMKLA